MENNWKAVGTMPNNLTSILGYNFQLYYEPLGNVSFTSNHTNHTDGRRTAIEGRDEFIAKIEQSVLIIIFILTILGNCLVLLGIHLRKEKMTRMYYFLLHLSLADLITAFFQVLPQLLWKITYRFEGGPVLCKSVKFLQILGPYSSSYILVMTGLDRYYALCFPLSYYSWTARRSNLMLGTAWILALTCCLPQLYIFSYQEVMEGSGVYDCWATFAPNWGEKAYITWYSISIFVIPLIILCFVYIRITRVIWHNFSIKKATSDEDPHVGFKGGVELDKKKSWARASTCQNSLTNEERIFTQSQQKETETSCPQTQLEETPEETNRLNITNGTYTSARILKTRREANQSNPSFLHYVVSRENFGQFAKISANYRHTNCITGNEDLEGFFEMNSLNSSTHALKILNSTEHLANSSFLLAQKLASHDADINLPNKKNDAELEKEIKPSALNPSVPFESRRGKEKEAYSFRFSDTHLRTHSLKGISRAKIKSVKMTITVICCYIICSTPFIAALLWSAYDPYAKEHPFFYGPIFSVLTLLASLNSCANAWIVLLFNRNLLRVLR